MHDAAAPLEVDPRPRQLLESYLSLVGGSASSDSNDLLSVEIPASERRFFGNRARLTVALSPNVLEEYPNADILVLGSALLANLLIAVRQRGWLEHRGTLNPTTTLSTSILSLGVEVEDADASVGRSEVVARPIGQLIARVQIRAGPALFEKLVETSVVNLGNGNPEKRELSDACASAVIHSGAAAASALGAKRIARRAANELLPLLFKDLEQGLTGLLAEVRSEAQRQETVELARIDRYYEQLLDDTEVDGDGNTAAERKRALRANHARRRAEEQERFQVRATVFPVQLVEWLVLSQHMTWTLRSLDGRVAEVSATRDLVGDTRWVTVCPSCGRVPTLLRVCHHSHAACGACSDRCAVCGQACCTAHGLNTCHAEGHATCDRHVRTCALCGNVHCVAHEATCTAHDHRVCSTCVIACERCRNVVCTAHGFRTGEMAPLGARWLCQQCTVACEGGRNELVGLDEVERCASCERYVCHAHIVKCAVDNHTHCSRHLRRSDHSGRLVCERHRTSCVEEPNAILASDEVVVCATCGHPVCERHRHGCYADDKVHCAKHLSPLKDRRGDYACASHRTVCIVDGVAFSLTGTKECPVCAQNMCADHYARCKWCGRVVCSRDVEGDRCRTCQTLEWTVDPDDDLLAAAQAANRGEPTKAKSWRTSRDARHTIVELDMGWRRRLVLSVPHGETRPAIVLAHGLLGSRRLR